MMGTPTSLGCKTSAAGRKIEGYKNGEHACLGCAARISIVFSMAANEFPRCPYMIIGSVGHLNREPLS
jgi:hypothetical protein